MMTRVMRARRAIAAWIWAPVRELDTKTTIMHIVAPGHEALAAAASTRFRAWAEREYPSRSYWFSFRSPIDRMARFVSLAVTVLDSDGRPIRNPNEYGLDGCGVFVDVDLKVPFPSQVEEAIMYGVDQLIAKSREDFA